MNLIRNATLGTIYGSLTARLFEPVSVVQGSKTVSLQYIQGRMLPNLSKPTMLLSNGNVLILLLTSSYFIYAIILQAVQIQSKL